MLAFQLSIVSLIEQNVLGAAIEMVVVVDGVEGKAFDRDREGFAREACKGLSLEKYINLYKDFVSSSQLTQSFTGSQHH